MKSKFLFAMGLIMVAGGLVFWSLQKQSMAPDSLILESQTNEEGPVTVMVQPRLQAKEWIFELTLNSHSEDILTDLQENAFLKTSSGKELKPLSWEGDPPGGHHRKGMLKFKPLKTKTIDLRVRNAGGVSERIFQWND